MKYVLAAAAMLVMTAPATAQQIAANNGYLVCPAAQTQTGKSVVAAQCGDLQAPDFANARFNSLSEMEAAQANRDQFTRSVAEYGTCVSGFIRSFQVPGAAADSTEPDQAACAHSWAEDQATKAVRDFGKACIDFSNRSMTTSSIEPWAGDCHPTATSNQG